MQLEHAGAKTVFRARQNDVSGKYVLSVSRK